MTTPTATVPPTTTLLELLSKSGLAHTRFLELLLKPHEVNPQIASDLKSREDAALMRPEKVRLAPTKEAASGTEVEIWRPSGAWRWARGASIHRCNNIINLTVDPKSRCKSYYGTGTIGSQELEFYCRSWPRGLSEFKNELTLYKAQLSLLRGTYVPNIIGVYSGPDDTINMLMELPHAQFWLEASDDMPDVLKKRCVDCFEKIHAAGVLHGSPRLHNIFIGGDARVSVANFEHASVLESVPEVTQNTTSPDKLRLEMRQVKYLLNYGNARATEQQRWLRYQARLEWNERQREYQQSNPEHTPEFLEEPEEEKLDPPVNVLKEKGWRSDRHKARRYVNPTISNEAFTTAVEKFISNIRRMEREGDGPPKSPHPTVQHLPSPPSESADAQEDERELTPSQSSHPRRSSRKRKGSITDTPTPAPKRQRKANKHDTPSSTNPLLSNKPIRLESFIVGCSKDFESSIPSATPSHQTRDATLEPTPVATTELRSAFKSVPATFVTPPPEIERPPIAPRSVTARSKRKRRRDEEDGVIKIEEVETPRKRARADADQDPLSSAGTGKRVSFAPAPEVHLKKWDIPPEMLTPAKFKYFHGPSGFRRRRHRHSPPPSSGGGFRLFSPPLPFRFVVRWVTDVLHRVQS